MIYPYSSVSSLVSVSVDLDVRQKYSDTRRIFNPFLGVGNAARRDLSFLIDHLIQEEGVGDRKQGPEGGGDKYQGERGRVKKLYIHVLYRRCTVFPSLVQIHVPFLCFCYVLANSLKTSKQIMSSQCHQ